jgi:hypothetical protein
VIDWALRDGARAASLRRPLSARGADRRRRLPPERKDRDIEHGKA